MTDRKRRKFIAISATVVVLPVSALLKAGTASANDLPLLDAESGQAKAFKYTAQSITDGQTCSNCAIYTGAKDAQSGPCGLFQGKHVGSGAWCGSWTAKS